jgi:hypothetical protein
MCIKRTALAESVTNRFLLMASGSRSTTRRLCSTGLASQEQYSVHSNTARRTGSDASAVTTTSVIRYPQSKRETIVARRRIRRNLIIELRMPGAKMTAKSSIHAQFATWPWRVITKGVQCKFIWSHTGKSGTNREGKRERERERLNEKGRHNGEKKRV